VPCDTALACDRSQFEHCKSRFSRDWFYTGHLVLRHSISEWELTALLQVDELTGIACCQTHWMLEGSYFKQLQTAISKHLLYEYKVMSRWELWHGSSFYLRRTDVIAISSQGSSSSGNLLISEYGFWKGDPDFYRVLLKLTIKHRKKLFISKLMGFFACRK